MSVRWVHKTGMEGYKTYFSLILRHAGWLLNCPRILKGKGFSNPFVARYFRAAGGITLVDVVVVVMVGILFLLAESATQALPLCLIWQCSTPP